MSQWWEVLVILDGTCDNGWTVHVTIIMMRLIYTSFFSEASLPAAPEAHVIRPIKRSVFARASLRGRAVFIVMIRSVRIFSLVDAFL